MRSALQTRTNLFDHQVNILDDTDLPQNKKNVQRTRGIFNNASLPTQSTIIKNEKHGVFLHQGDTLTLMDCLIKDNPDGIFDMIFADPPYFLSNGGITCQNGQMVSVHKGKWDESAGAEENHKFNLEWLKRCQKLLKPNGTIWVSGTSHVIHSIGFAMQQLGLKFLNDITWEKPNPPPNLSCRYFTHSTETIIWAAKNDKSKHLFNYDIMREQNGGKQMKTVWNFTAPGKNEKLLGKHPTQKPIELLERILLSSTHKDDIIFDPFAGSSTTGVAAINHNRRFVGFEIEEEFINLSKDRLLDSLKYKRQS